MATICQRAADLATQVGVMILVTSNNCYRSRNLLRTYEHMTLNYIRSYCSAALQLAADAPRNSHVSKAAACFHRKPDGQLVNKEEEWSPCLTVIREPSGGKITSTCFSPDGYRVSYVLQRCKSVLFSLHFPKCKTSYLPL